MAAGIPYLRVADAVKLEKHHEEVTKVKNVATIELGKWEVLPSTQRTLQSPFSWCHMLRGMLPQTGHSRPSPSPLQCGKPRVCARL